MNQGTDQTQEKQIDLSLIAKLVWNQRKKVIKWSVTGLLIGIVIAISIPREYTSEAKVAPESQNKQIGGSMGALASMIGTGSPNSSDGINEKLYPAIIKSTPFLLEFASIEVSYQNAQMPLWKYMLDHRKKAWWSYVISAPSQAIGWVLSMGKETIDTMSIQNSPRTQYAFVSMMNEAIKTELDNKIGIFAIKTTVQDPVIAKMITDSVIVKIQHFMIDYRTAKTRNTLETTYKLLIEAKDRYYEADEAYARGMDRNQNLITKSAQVALDRLRNERDLAYQVYSQLAEQVETNRIKLQEEMPVATVIEPPTTPLSPSAPSKMLIILGCTFLLGFISTISIVIKQLLKK